jgi:NAD(P)-dependent dehydrogenase (short-subunit alcohol dehydrogenase family)
MAKGRLAGKRVLVTQAKDYMGPDTIELFREEGAEVIADETDLTQPGAVQSVVDSAGHIDVLVANLAADAHFGVMALDTDDAIWQAQFEVMVHPLHHLCRAVLPQMYERNKGKIVVYGSATGIRAQEGVLAYGTARAAQVGYVRTLGVEAARHNVQVNLIAQHFVESEVYFPAAFQATSEFEAELAKVPLGRLAKGREDALFALFLASDESDFFVGQSIAFCGGWAE